MQGQQEHFSLEACGGYQAGALVLAVHILHAFEHYTMMYDISADLKEAVSKLKPVAFKCWPSLEGCRSVFFASRQLWLLARPTDMLCTGVF